MKNKLLLLAVFLLHNSQQSYAQPSSFTPRGIGGGGALFFPTVNPINDNEFYVSCDMSELFHTKDFGKSYSQVDYSKLQVFNTSTYEFTIDPNIAYNNFNDGNEGYPVKTNDGGATWNKLSGYNVTTYGKVYNLKANYNNASQLLVGAYGDILFSKDGGASFTLVKHATNMGAGIIMGGVFWDGLNIYIGTNEGIISSNNGGTTFSTMTTTGIPIGQVIWSFAGAKLGPTTRFVCIAANNAGTYNGIMPWNYTNFAKGVYTMDNASAVWLPKSTGINFTNDFVMYAGMATNDVNTIYLGGHDKSLDAPLVYKSTNGGSTWTKKFNTTNNLNITTAWEGFSGDKNWSWSETCFGITVAPNNSSKVLFGTYSNVQVSSDGGDNWSQAYVSSSDENPSNTATPKNKAYHSIGLENTSCWQVYWQNASTMMGSFSDLGAIRSIDTGKSWGYLYSGFSVNSLYRLVKDSANTIYGGCSNIHDMYQSTRLQDAQLDAADANGKIVYSADNGATWANIHSFGHPVYWLKIDPSNNNRMYASVVHFGGTAGAQLGGIYKTDNLKSYAASTWTKLANPPRTEGHPACIEVLKDGKMVCTFSGRRNPSGTFTASSGVFLYDPATDSWTDVSDPGMYYWTKDIVIDPSDPSQNTWYVGVFSGWGGAPSGLGGLYKTTNRGASWTKLTGTKFDRVTSITFNPQNAKQAYLTTETQGLWISDDMNAASPSWKVVSSYPFRQPERVFFNPFNQTELWVSSFGNGMKMGKIDPTSSAPLFHKDIVSHINCYPNPNKGSFDISLFASKSEQSDLSIMDMSGKIVYQQKCQLNTGNNTIAVAASQLSKGIYIITLSNGIEKHSLKIDIE